MILESTPAGRVLHLEQWEIELLASTLDALASPHGDYCRILHGTGLDTSDVALLEVRDVDRAPRKIRGPSGKTFNRKRSVLVLEWAWPSVERRMARKRPTDRLFAELPADRHAHSKAMKDARDHLVQQGQLQFQNYQARDSRHSVAVMMRTSGVVQAGGIHGWSGMLSNACCRGAREGCQHRNRIAHFHRAELHTRWGASHQVAAVSFERDRDGRWGSRAGG